MSHQVGRGLIQPQSRKIEAVQQAARPANKTQVHAFLGLVGYYHCFIPSFSSIASPLTDLTKKGQPKKLKWTAEAEAALQILKGALSPSPVLHAQAARASFRRTLPTPA